MEPARIYYLASYLLLMKSLLLKNELKIYRVGKKIRKVMKFLQISYFKIFVTGNGPYKLAEPAQIKTVHEG